MALSSATSKELQELIKKRHPEYKVNEPHWNFLEATYRGGREWFQSENVFKYLKEGDDEYDDRLKRAYRFNHTKEVVDLVNKYIFKATVTRNEDDASEPVKKFWKKATRDGRGIKFLVRQIGQKASVFGRIYVFVDNTAVDGVLTVAEEKEMNARVYAYIVKPQNVVDLSVDEFGDLNWILVREIFRNDSSPLDDGLTRERYRLWTKNSWTLMEVENEGKKSVKVYVIDSKDHGLGKVPCVPIDHIESDSDYSAPSLIGDISYLDRAVANYLSNLDAIIQDQTFSQLAIPAQGMLPGEEGVDKLVEMGTKRIFTFDGENGSVPFFLSPDPKQAAMILTVVEKIITEIYHSVGMAGERTKQDNSMSIDSSSGVAKAYDFERMNALLTSKAAGLEYAENKITDLVNLWNSKDTFDEKDLVKYPENFDVRSLYDEFDIAERLMLIDAPDDMRQEQMKLVITKLFPRLKKKLLAELMKLEGWPPKEPTPTDTQPPKLTAGKESKQGQVKDDGSGKEAA